MRKHVGPADDNLWFPTQLRVFRSGAPSPLLHLLQEAPLSFWKGRKETQHDTRDGESPAHGMCLDRWSDWSPAVLVRSRCEVVFIVEREDHETGGVRLSDASDDHDGHADPCQTRSENYHQRKEF